MKVTTKILVALLFAAAVGLSSCVNEVQTTANAFPSDTSTTPIDTNILHSFKNISITFVGACEYYYSLVGMPQDALFTIGYNSTNSDIPGNEVWTGKHFEFLGNLDTIFSHGPDSNGLGFVRTLRKSIHLDCYVSRGGRQIDSGQFTSYYYDYSITTHDYVYHGQNTILRFQFLPQSVLSSDSLIYSFSGNRLRDNIVFIQDSSIDLGSTFEIPRSGVPYVNGLKEILWDRSPSPKLEIKFSK